MRAADPAVASAREELTLDEALHRVGECGYGQAYIFGLVTAPLMCCLTALLPELCAAPWCALEHLALVAGMGWPCANLSCAAGARQVGLALVASALQNHLTVFAALGPLREGLVTCTGTDAACAARLVQPLADVCGLDRAAWRWTDKCGPSALPSPPCPEPSGCQTRSSLYVPESWRPAPHARAIGLLVDGARSTVRTGVNLTRRRVCAGATRPHRSGTWCAARPGSGTSYRPPSSPAGCWAVLASAGLRTSTVRARCGSPAGWSPRAVAVERSCAWRRC